MKKINLLAFALGILILLSCQQKESQKLDKDILASLGSEHRIAFSDLAGIYEEQLAVDSDNLEAHLGLAEAEIILYVFGYVPRDETIPIAEAAYAKARMLDSLDSDVQKLDAILYFLDWDWENAEKGFLRSIQTNPENLNARHWYSLYLAAMGRIDEAMSQSDIIMSMDDEGNYLIGRGSMLYFARRFEDMKSLMIKAVKMDTTVAWGYDWLGMAYIELEEYDNSLKTYYKAFELSDGTVEVGAGLGHALGQAGHFKVAKQMADYYVEASKTRYLPYCQRAFIHIGIGEYPAALDLLEQAYQERSWFLIFMKIEPWYDPIRNEERFQKIAKRLNFPE